jgi:hypothetical protein
MNLELLTSEFPSDAGTVERLVSFFESRQKASREPDASGLSKSYSIEKIFSIAEPSSEEVFAKLLIRLEQQGLISPIIRVEIDSLGIDDYPSIDKVPDEIYNFHNGQYVPVNLSHLHLYYKLQK